MPYIDKEKRKVYIRNWMRQARIKNPSKYPPMTGTMKKWREDNKEKWKEQKRRWYYKHQKRELDKIKKQKKEYRRQVLEYYGGNPPKCACCNESIYSFLTLNHINGGGVKERKKIGPSNLMRYLIKQGFPKGYNVLCYNCNCANAFIGICPHKLDRSQI